MGDDIKKVKKEVQICKRDFFVQLELWGPFSCTGHLRVFFSCKFSLYYDLLKNILESFKISFFQTPLWLSLRIGFLALFFTNQSPKDPWRVLLQRKRQKGRRKACAKWQKREHYHKRCWPAPIHLDDRKGDRDSEHKLSRSSLLRAAQDAWISILFYLCWVRSHAVHWINALRKQKRRNEWTKRKGESNKKNK